MLATFSRLKKFKKQSSLKISKDWRYGLLSLIGFVLILNGGRANAQAAPSCVGWLCGPKNSLANAFPDGSAMVNVGFLMMQGIVVAILVGIGAILINRIANREDYGAPMATFFGTVLILLLINYLAGYVFGSGGATTTTPLPVPVEGFLYQTPKLFG